jgi:hypothetical protein
MFTIFHSCFIYFLFVVVFCIFILINIFCKCDSNYFVYTLFWQNPSDWFIFCQMIAFIFTSVKAHIIFHTPITNFPTKLGLRSKCFKFLYFSGSCIHINPQLSHCWYYLHWLFKILKIIIAENNIHETNKETLPFLITYQLYTNYYI